MCKKKCKFCEELNSETQKMRIQEIYIGTAGHFQYCCPINYCPACGTKLNQRKES